MESWAQIRILSGYYMYLTTMKKKLGDRDRRLFEKAEESDELNRKIQQYRRKRNTVRGDATSIERLSKYERKIKRYKEERNQKFDFVEDLNDKYGELKLKAIVRKRKTAKKDLEEKLSKFKTLKWITILDIPELVAIHIRRGLNLDGENHLRFTVGSSVKEGMLSYLRLVAKDLGIGPLDSKNLFELTGREIRLMTPGEATDVGFKVSVSA